MTNQIAAPDTFMQYVTAYTAHYGSTKLENALELYLRLIADHPGTREAEYSRQQILNIIHDVVPKQELFDAQVELAVKHFKQHVGTASADVTPPTE